MKIIFEDRHKYDAEFIKKSKSIIMRGMSLMIILILVWTVLVEYGTVKPVTKPLGNLCIAASTRKKLNVFVRKTQEPL